MDILAHALWAGAGMAMVARRRSISRGTVVLTVGAAVMPDVVQSLPVAAWALPGVAPWDAWLAYVLASPGTEPVLPAWVGLSAHHLHCALHSAVVAAAVTALVWAVRRAFWMPLAGWWLHIVIDVFSHSAEYYPVPVWYPISYHGFDGIAWNKPWFMALNYGLLAVVMVVLLMTRQRKR